MFNSSLQNNQFSEIHFKASLIQSAKKSIIKLTNSEIITILKKIQIELLNNQNEILHANKIDLENFATQQGINHPNYDRLLLNNKRLESVIKDVDAIIDSKINTDLNLLNEFYDSEKDITIQKISVPLGAIGVIYESRPNVTIDVFFNCFRTKNVTILKGGKDAFFTNQAIVNIIKRVLQDYQLENTITLLGTNRSEIDKIIKNPNFIDLCIARGGKALIDFVKNNSLVPFIETGAGVVNLYFDKSGDIKKAQDIIFNAKTRRVSVCNALDCIIIHKERLGDLFNIVKKLAEKNVLIYADENSFKELYGKYELLEKFIEKEHLNKEFLDYKISVITTNNIQEAIDFISNYTSHHSEMIITEDTDAINNFVQQIDSSTICVNSSSAFVDGVQMNIGPEIGISTQKLHARGPFSMESLTTIKYIIKSNSGAVRG